MQAEELSTVNLAAIGAARARIAPFVRRTPLWPSHTLSQRLGAQVFLKMEIFQKTGSFKVRGAFNKMAGLAPGTRVVAVSGGNHAQAVAYAAGVLGLHAAVFMPKNTPSNYVEATRGYGAEIHLSDDIAAAFAGAHAMADAGAVMVHPFDDADVIAGQGTMGLEILEDLPGATDVFVSIGGGGMSTGVATAVKGLSPATRMWGVETEGADAMAQALAAGKVVRLDKITSIARTLGAPAVSPLTLRATQQWFEQVLVVPDAEALAELRYLLERCKVLTEPAASCTLAAALRLKPRWRPQDKVVLVLCGGNFALDS